MADACLFLMNLPDSCFQPLLGGDRNHGVAPLVNVGVGVVHSILQLAQLVAEFIDFKGAINTDPPNPMAPLENSWM
jgi:GDP-L-fucose synthase